jgi:hypothetical protein
MRWMNLVGNWRAHPILLCNACHDGHEFTVAAANYRAPAFDRGHSPAVTPLFRSCLNLRCQYTRILGCSKRQPWANSDTRSS